MVAGGGPDEPRANHSRSRVGFSRLSAVDQARTVADSSRPKFTYSGVQTMVDVAGSEAGRCASGVPGLDSVLGGGFLTGRSYLVLGGPGTGKSTLGLHFLAAGRVRDSLLVSLDEPKKHVHSDAASMGIALGDLGILDFSPTAREPDESVYTVLEPWEAEAPDIRARVEQAFPDGVPERIFVDGLSQLRQLVPDDYQFRRQVIALLQYLNRSGATVLFSAETDSDAARDLAYVSDGILRLEARQSRRVLSVPKFRGSGVAEGEHSLRLDGQGMRVYERLIPREHCRDFSADSISSGVIEIDALTGGGLDRGTTTLVSGPAGVGKTSLGIRFLCEAAQRGENSVIFSFEERFETLVRRCEAMAMPVGRLAESGHLSIVEIEPLHYGPDEFAHAVRHAVEADGARVVMIDSISGYRQSIHDQDVSIRLHALCRYLVNMGVTVLLINEQREIAGGPLRISDDSISYLGDAIILLRYLELEGELHKAIGMLKKRTGDFEKTLREYRMTASGLDVGKPLTRLRGILHGVPEVVGEGGREDAAAGSAKPS